MTRRRRPVRSPGLLIAMAVLLVGCGSDSPLAADCDPVVTEDLDPTWTVHLLPTAEAPDYRTDPPTSGPHYAAEPLTGVQTEPVDDALQVTVLEVGGVLLQFRPADVGGTDLDRLERLAGESVVVAPDPGLPAPVVATAWITKQTCEGVDLDALSTFVDAHGGSGPGAAG